MGTNAPTDPAAEPNPTTVERRSDCEMVVTRIFNAPPRLVFAAWTRPELLLRWWAPRSMGMSFLSCEIDARTGGGYRFVFSHPDVPQPMAFFGRYLEVTPPARLVWTNEESGGDGQITTVIFEDLGDRTRVELHDLYPSKAELEASGFASDMREPFEQLDALLLDPARPPA